MVSNVTNICLGIVCVLVGALMLALYLDSDQPVGFNRHDRRQWKNSPPTYKPTRKPTHKPTTTTNTKPTNKPTSVSTNGQSNRNSRKDGKNNIKPLYKLPPVEVNRIVNFLKDEKDLEQKRAELIDDYISGKKSSSDLYRNRHIQHVEQLDAVLDFSGKQFMVIGDNGKDETPRIVRFQLSDDAVEGFRDIIRLSNETGSAVLTYVNSNAMNDRRIGKNYRRDGDQILVAVNPSTQGETPQSIIMCNKPVPPRRSSRYKCEPANTRWSRYKAKKYLAREQRKDRQRRAKAEEMLSAEAKENNDGDDTETGISLTPATTTSKTRDEYEALFKSKGGVCLGASLSKSSPPTKTISTKEDQEKCEADRAKKAEDARQQCLDKSDDENVENHKVAIPGSPYEAIRYRAPKRIGETDSFLQLMQSPLKR